MMQRRSLVICALALLVLMTAGEADAIIKLDTIRWEQAQRFRFWGKIELSYRNYEEEVNGIESNDVRFDQVYGVGMSGYVWRPKFMIFTSDLTYSTSRGEFDFVSGNTSSNIGFNMSGIVFPRTPFPLIVGAGRNVDHLEGEFFRDREVTTTYFNTRWTYPIMRNTRMTLDYSHRISEADESRTGSSTLTNDSFIVDILGHAPRRPALFENNVVNNRNANRNANANNLNSEGNNNGDNADLGENSNNNNNANMRNNRNQGNIRNRGAIKRGFSDYLNLSNWGLTYEFLRTKTEGRYFYVQDLTSHKLRLFAHRPVLGFLGYGELVLYKDDENKRLDAGLTLERQSERFRTYNTYRFKREITDLDMNTTHQVSSYNTYWYSKNLVFNGSFTYNRRTYEPQGRVVSSSRAFSRSRMVQNYTLGLGATYSRYFSKHLFQAFVAGAVGASSDGTTSTDRDSFYSASYGMRLEGLPRMFRTFSYRYYAEYFGSYDKDERAMNRINMAFDVSKTIRRLSLSVETDLAYNFNSVRGGTTTKGLALGVKGTASMRINSFSTFSVIADYTLTKNDRDEETRVLDIRETLDIILYRKLSLHIAANQRKIVRSDNTETRYYEVLSGLDYRLRKLFLHGEYNVSKEEEDNAGEIRKRTIFLKVTRPFG